ncbi:hypothetical protein Avbf_11812 [Armadillidium vulgare]|nr:hypothetical protein Avbf_11812 [Armadillidium vulgare]
MAEASAAASSSILDSLEETILSNMGIAEVSNTSEEKKSLLQAIEEKVRPLRYSRGIVKRKITFNPKANLSNHFFLKFLCFRVTALCFECLSIRKVKLGIITKLEQSFHRYL